MRTDRRRVSKFTKMSSTWMRSQARKMYTCRLRKQIASKDGNPSQAAQNVMMCALIERWRQRRLAVRTELSPKKNKESSTLLAM